MLIVWDEEKRRSNIQKHGIDFADFEAAFRFKGADVSKARPSRTGRPRYKFVGRMDGHAIVAAIVSPLGTEALSMVSLRPATQKERRGHGP